MEARVLIKNSLDLDDVVDAILAGQPLIPVVGPMSFTVTHEGREWRLPDLLLAKLPGLLQIDGDLADPYTLEDIIDAFKRRGGGVDKIRARLYRFISQADWKPDETLEILASFKFIEIYLTTTPDKLLAEALRSARCPANGPLVREFLDDNTRGEDIPTQVERHRTPVVYHLFGKLAPDNYAVTDSDYMERITSLLDRSQQPKMLFQQLRRSHLLFLGVGFDGWLARFFLQVVRGQRLTTPRTGNDLLVDPAISNDTAEVLFLQNCSEDAKIAHRQSTERFVSDLRDQLQIRAPHLIAPPASGKRPKPTTPVCPGGQPPASVDGGATFPDGAEMKAGAIFLSYASEDRECVQRIYDRLKAERLDVWMDIWEIKSGNWKKTIRRFIRSCSLFIPVLSRVMTTDLSARPFRQEWYDAFEKLPDLYGTNNTFIHPIRIDDVDLAAEGVDVFSSGEMHVVNAPTGDLNSAQVAEIKRLYRQRQLAEKRARNRHG